MFHRFFTKMYIVSLLSEQGLDARSYTAILACIGFTFLNVFKV